MIKQRTSAILLSYKENGAQIVIPLFNYTQKVNK